MKKLIDELIIWQKISSIQLKELKTSCSKFKLQFTGFLEPFLRCSSICFKKKIKAAKI